jgi:hypothetical protein
MWLIQERGLAVATVLRYESTARRFLQQQAMAGGVLKPAGLAGTDVNAFLLRECGRVSAGSAKARVAELRAVLRFLSPTVTIEAALAWAQQAPKSATAG